MRRAVVLLLITVLGTAGESGCASNSRRTTGAQSAHRLASGRNSRPAYPVAVKGHGVWSSVVTLVSPDQGTSPPRLAVSGGGDAVAAWLQGPPPRVYLGAAHTSSAAPTTSVQKVVVDLGTLGGGFGQPLVVRSGPSGSLGAPWVAASGSDAFVAWGTSPGSDVWLAVLRNGHVAMPAVLLLRDAVPVAFHAVGGGRVAIVWDQYGHGFPLLKVALVDTAGQLGTPVTIAHTNGQDTAATAVSVNDRGELIAAWIHGDGIRYRRPGVPFATRTAQVIVSICRPAQRCTAPHAMSLGKTRPACVNPAVAMSPNGTAIVVAAAQDPGPHGCTKPLGVWDAVGAPGHSIGTATMIASAGDLPVAAPSGVVARSRCLTPVVFPTERWRGRS